MSLIKDSTTCRTRMRGKDQLNGRPLVAATLPWQRTQCISYFFSIVDMSRQETLTLYSTSIRNIWPYAGGIFANFTLKFGHFRCYGNKGRSYACS